MVFRLGAGEDGKTTRFGLVRSGNPVSEYFLLDDDVFGGAEGVTHLPSIEMRQIFPFQVLPDLTETSLVNLAIASGVLSEALQIDEGSIPTAPARSQSTFSFRVRLHRSLEHVLTHNRGQVEIEHHGPDPASRECRRHDDAGPGQGVGPT